MSAKRITITITDNDKLWLDGYAKVHKILVAEAIRHGIRHLKQGQRQKTYQKLLENTCGIWKKKRPVFSARNAGRMGIDFAWHTRPRTLFKRP